MKGASRPLLSSILEARTGQQLTNGRMWRIEAALQSLMRAHGVPAVDQLIAKLASGRDDELAELVVDALLNKETYFFRDIRSFTLLLEGALRRMKDARASQRRLSIWCAGCSTGQEVYSLAMAFAEDEERWAGWTIDLLGTDVSRPAIEQAKQGRYSQFEVQRGLPISKMIRWFAQSESQEWQVRAELRRKVRFQVHNLVRSAPPPGRFDLILCRNVLLYFSEPVRRQVFGALAAAGAPDATLMLGAGETALGQTNDFVSDPEFRGLYVRNSEASSAHQPRTNAA